MSEADRAGRPPPKAIDPGKRTGPVSAVYPDGRIVHVRTIYLEDKKDRKPGAEAKVKLVEVEDDDVIYKIDVVGHERAWELARVYGKRQVESATEDYRLSPGEEFRVTGLYRYPWCRTA